MSGAPSKKFVDLAALGEVHLEAINDYVDQWHDDASIREDLTDYLGTARSTRMAC